MRRIISGVLVYCLLHTSTYAAVTDLQSLNPATTPHTPSHVNYGKLDPSIPDATTVSISADTSSKMLDIPHRPKAKRSPAFFMTMAGIAAVVFTGMWWKIQTPSVVQTDVCFHHQNRDHISHLQQKNDHRWNGNMPLTAGIQDWLNANTAVMTSLGEIAHDLRHGDHEHVGEKWSKTQSTLYNVLHNHGVEHLGARSIACDINLGDGTTPDRISACEHRKTPKHLESETFKDGVGARLWLNPDRNQRLLARNINYVAGSFIDNQLYPNPVQSLNIESKEAKYDSRRKLLQTGNTLPLPQAIQTTINDREDVRVLLATIRGTLRQWDPSTAKISELNALTKSIFEAHGFVMTGDVHCGFVLENGGVMLSDCALASSGSADRSFAAQTALEKVTFMQSADNPVKVDGVEIETNVLPAQEALPLVLQRAANALHTELDQLRQDRCSVNDRSNVLAVQRVVKDALETPNAALSTDMACDVTIGNGGITEIRCAPGVAPESAVCGTYNGTFKTEGRVWVTPNGGFVVSANRNWNRTVERPHTPSPERSESLTLKRTHTPNLSQTPQHTPSASLPAPQNTTTRLYWANPNSYQIWMSNVTDGNMIGTPRRAFPTIFSRFYALDFVENTIYYSTISNDNSGGLYKTGFNRSNIDNPIDSSQYKSLRGGNSPLVNSMSICPNHDCIFWTEMNNGLFYGKLNISAQEPITNIKTLIVPTFIPNKGLFGTSFVGLHINYNTQDIIWGYKAAPTAIYRNRYSFFPNKTIYLTDYQEALWQPNTTTTNAIGYLISLSVDSINQKIFIRTDRGNIFYSDLYQQQNVSSLRLLRSHTEEYPILTEGGILIYE